MADDDQDLEDFLSDINELAEDVVVDSGAPEPGSKRAAPDEPPPEGDADAAPPPKRPAPLPAADPARPGDQEADPLDQFMDELAAQERSAAADAGQRMDLDDGDCLDGRLLAAQAAADAGDGADDAGDGALLPAFRAGDQAAAPVVRPAYEPHPTIEALTHAEVQAVYDELDMTVTGRAPLPHPVAGFHHLPFDGVLMDEIRRRGYDTLTPVQRQAVPTALSGRDLLALAKTGSGKTAAYLWPAFAHVMAQDYLEPGDGPIAVILAPTRELAMQIIQEAKRYARGYKIGVAALCSGVQKREQLRALRDGSEIAVATPGRFIQLVRTNKTNLRRVSFLVVDEADNMLQKGFELQVRSICEAIRPDRQTLFFSATMTPHVQRMAFRALSDPVRLVIGLHDAANADVRQSVHILANANEKWAWLTARLASFVEAGSVIVFVSQRTAATELGENLNKAGFPNRALHGDVHAIDRAAIVKELRAGALRLLVATDLASRGLDIPLVKTVVNFDVANKIQTHIHRCGRTGRAGDLDGVAYTLLSAVDDVHMAGQLVENLKRSNQLVPQKLVDLASKSARFRQQQRKPQNASGFAGKPRRRTAAAGDGRALQGGQFSARELESSFHVLFRKGGVQE